KSPPPPKNTVGKKKSIKSTKVSVQTGTRKPPLPPLTRINKKKPVKNISGKIPPPISDGIVKTKPKGPPPLPKK
ncbi:hypothetical protein N9H19_03425, partial [Flavobacteriales bacterium]|nr:hypothetical protein [Flavobacteriales bacterium]